MIVLPRTFFGLVELFSAVRAVHFNLSLFSTMKLSSKILAGILLAFWISGAPAFLFASQKNLPGAITLHQEGSPYAVDIPLSINENPALLKWPRGKLIYPETNKPDKTSEVFLFGEALTSPEALASLYHHYGFQFFSRKKYGKAKEEYLKALKLQPDIPAIPKHLGLIYLKSKEYKNAEAAYRKALQLDPGYTTAMTKLGISLVGQKKYTLAERNFKRAIKADPSNANFHLNLGHFYFYLKNNFKGAKRSYQKALKLNPRLKEAKSNLRSIKKRFKKWKNQESNFKSSWGPDFDYDDSKNVDQLESPNRPPEEANISGVWEEQNTQRPLF